MGISIKVTLEKRSVYRNQLTEGRCCAILDLMYKFRQECEEREPAPQVPQESERALRAITKDEIRRAGCNGIK